MTVSESGERKRKTAAENFKSKKATRNYVNICKHTNLLPTKRIMRYVYDKGKKKSSKCFTDGFGISGDSAHTQFCEKTKNYLEHISKTVELKYPILIFCFRWSRSPSHHYFQDMMNGLNVMKATADASSFIEMMGLYVFTLMVTKISQPSNSDVTSSFEEATLGDGSTPFLPKGSKIEYRCVGSRRRIKNGKQWFETFNAQIQKVYHVLDHYGPCMENLNTGQAVAPACCINLPKSSLVRKKLLNYYKSYHIACVLVGAIFVDPLLSERRTYREESVRDKMLEMLIRDIFGACKSGPEMNITFLNLCINFPTLNHVNQKKGEIFKMLEKPNQIKELLRLSVAYADYKILTGVIAAGLQGISSVKKKSYSELKESGWKYMHLIQGKIISMHAKYIREEYSHLLSF